MIILILHYYYEQLLTTIVITIPKSGSALMVSDVVFWGYAQGYQGLESLVGLGGPTRWSASAEGAAAELVHSKLGDLLKRQ